MEIAADFYEILCSFSLRLWTEDFWMMLISTGPAKVYNPILLRIRLGSTFGDKGLPNLAGSKLRR